MVGGMATIAGGVMAAYIQILGNSYAETLKIPLAPGAASVCNAAARCKCNGCSGSFVNFKNICFPKPSEPETKGKVKIEIEKNASNVVEAAANGASEGLSLALNVGAMLIAFIALIALINYILIRIGNITGWNAALTATYGQPLNFQLIIGLF